MKDSEALNAVDEKISVLMNLREAWINEGFSPGIEERIKAEITTFPKGRAVHEKFLETLQQEIEEREKTVPYTEARMLPVRNNVTDIPGYVTGYKEQNGLVHGGTVNAPGFSITVRAFRMTWMRRYHGSNSRKRDEFREVVVAGVVEKRIPTGQVVERWNSAPHQHMKLVSYSHYFNTWVTLPQPSIKIILDEGKGHRWNRAWEGYYFPAGWYNGGGQGDTGQPTYAHWPELGGCYFWDYTPAHATGIESPLYNSYSGGGPGYVICTPYVKVFHADPSSPEVIVSVVGIVRTIFQRKVIVSYFNRFPQWPNLGWQSKTFTA